MTTIQQQIEFIQDLADRWDGSQRERIVTDRDPNTVAELLRDVKQNLLGMQKVQLNQTVTLCHDCNQPLTPHNKVNFAVCANRITVTRDEDVCDGCATIRNERAQNETVGIP